MAKWMEVYSPGLMEVCGTTQERVVQHLLYRPTIQSILEHSSRTTSRRTSQQNVRKRQGPQLQDLTTMLGMSNQQELQVLPHQQPHPSPKDQCLLEQCKSCLCYLHHYSQLLLLNLLCQLLHLFSLKQLALTHLSSINLHVHQPIRHLNRQWLVNDRKHQDLAIKAQLFHQLLSDQALHHSRNQMVLSHLRSCHNVQVCLR